MADWQLEQVGDSYYKGDTPGIGVSSSGPWFRGLLTTGLTAAGVESLFKQQARYDTPHLAIAYQAPKASTFWRT